MVNTNNLSRKTNRRIDLRLAKSERILPDQPSHRIKHAMTRQRLSVVTGTTEEDLLDQLVDLGFSEDNLEAIRYTLYSGEPIVTGIMRLTPGSRFWAAFYIVMGVIQLATPAMALSSSWPRSARPPRWEATSRPSATSPSVVIW